MAKKPTGKRKEIAVTGLVVLQWLSYVMWGLTIAALTSVIGLVVEYNTNATSWVDPSSVFYAFAALTILLPLAVILDTIYSRYENSKKNVATSVVMVVHIVLYALIAVGALITLLFALVTQFTSVSATGDLVTIISAGVVTLLVAGLVLRIARPLQWNGLRLAFRIKLIIISLVAAGFAVAGPITYALTTREDRALRESAQFVSNTISGYVAQGNPLPEKLDTALNDGGSSYGDDTLKPIALRVVSEGTLTYKPNTQQPLVSEQNGQTNTTYFYELCATYAYALRSGGPSTYYGSPASSVDSDSAYKDFLDANVVTPGTTCYKLKTTSYDNL